MADEAVVFSPRFMLAAINKMDPIFLWTLATWFSDAEPENVEFFDLDKYRGKRAITPYVNPKDEATRVALAAYSTHTVKGPYKKDETCISADDLKQREMGTTIYTPQDTYGGRAEKKAGEALKELMRRFDTTDEVSAITGLITGKIPIVGPGINAEIDLNMPAANILEFADLDNGWNDYANATPIDDIRTWKKLPAASGGRKPRICMMGWRAADDFLKCLKQTNSFNQLDNRRVNRGTIEPMDLPDGIEYLGNIENIDIYTCDGTYVDTAGATQYFYPENKILLGPPKGSTRGIRLFGSIVNLNCMTATKAYPSSWVKDDGSGRIVQLEQRSIPIAYEIEDFVSVEVTETPS